MNGKIGFPGGKPNGTGLSTEIFSKKREYLQRYSSFLVFTGITGKSPYHLLYRTSAMLLGKSTGFRSRKWRPLSRFSAQHAVFILNKRKGFFDARDKKKEAILPFGHLLYWLRVPNRLGGMWDLTFFPLIFGISAEK